MQMIVKFQNFVHEILILFCFLLPLGCSVVRNTRPQMIINWCGSCQQQIKDSAMQYYCYFYHQNSCVFLSVSFPKKSQILYLFIISISPLSLSLFSPKKMVFIHSISKRQNISDHYYYYDSLTPPKDEADMSFFQTWFLNFQQL